MKIYIMLTLLLFTSCVSNNSIGNTPVKVKKNLEITVKKQGIEFEKLQEDNKILRKDIELLSERVQKIEEFYESN